LLQSKRHTHYQDEQQSVAGWHPGLPQVPSSSSSSPATMEEAFPHVHSDQLHALLYGLCIYEQAPNPDRFAMNEIIDDVFFVTCFFFFFFLW
jgi:hypothetical protein